MSAPRRTSRIRTLLSDDGVAWRVFELPATGPYGLAHHLIFDGAVVVRRLRDYPPNWYELSDCELARLGGAASHGDR